MTGNFYRNSDNDRLYLPRKMGRRGLKSIKLVYKCRLISICQHLLNGTHRNHYLKCIVEHEQDKIMRVGKELLDRFEIEHLSTESNQSKIPQIITRAYENSVFAGAIARIYKQIYISIARNGSTQKQWICNKYMTSHFEAKACAIQEQEIGTKDFISRRKKKVGLHTNNRCRLCKNLVEDMFHIISSCSRMSSRYYLPLRHDVIAKYVYEQNRMRLAPRCKVDYPADEFIHSEGNIEYW